MRLLTILAVAAVAAGIYQYRARRRPARPVLDEDAKLANAVRESIARAVSGPLDVRVMHGVVSLRGSVSRAERDLALAAALGVPGVTQVTNFMDTGEPIGEIGTMQSGIATGI